MADGSSFSPLIEEFRAEINGRGWIAEQPEAHLLPHIKRFCEATTSPFELAGAQSDGAGIFDVFLIWKSEKANFDSPRAGVFALLGSFCESATYVSQEVTDGSVSFLVVTGMLERQTEFKGHGHVVRLNVETSR